MSTQPKPFIFVLMPFDAKFNDIYTFGIKGAADEVDAYAERVDEQIFSEGILDRIFNQISKADVIIADMTGRNPNVFYEVGYAHALGKIVLLLTQSTDDIPFDLKHRQHTVYGGQIEALRRELVLKLQWAIAESRKQRRQGGTEVFSIRVSDSEIPRSNPAEVIDRDKLPRILGRVRRRQFSMPVHLRNDSPEAIVAITHVYLFCEKGAMVTPVELHPNWGMGFSYFGRPASLPAEEEEEEAERQKLYALAMQFPEQAFEPQRAFKASPIDAPDGLEEQYRLKMRFSALPPGAIEVASIDLELQGDKKEHDGVYRLRLHSSSQFYDFPFRLSVIHVPKEKRPSTTLRETGPAATQAES